MCIQAGFVVQTQKFRKTINRVVLSTFCAAFWSTAAVAGGGMVLSSDACILQIDFYSMHFTAFQPQDSGNTQFCQDLPATGPSILVLDYLHDSLKEVPVDFRVIRNVTGQGSFVKLKHVEEIGDLAAHTVFYQPPVIQADASLKIEYDFKEKGSYIAIVSAGHPTNNNIYTAVFPIEVGRSGWAYWPFVVVLLAVLGFVVKRRLDRSKKTTDTQEAV